MTKNNSYTLGTIVLTVLSALLLIPAFPPLNIFPMSFIALAPLNIIIYKANKIRYYIISAAVFVLVFFGYLLMWVSAFMLKETEAAIAFLALFTILFLLVLLFYLPAMLLSGFISKRLPRFRFIAIPIIFTFMEYMRNVGFLGFPWGIIGYSQWNFLPFIQIADTIGLLGVSFFIYFTNAVISHYILLYADKIDIKKDRKNYLPAVILVSSLILILIYGIAKLNLEESKRLRANKTKIALIQKSFDPNNYWREIYTGEPYRRNSGGIQGFAENFLLKSDKFKSAEIPDGVSQNGTISVKRVANLARDAALSQPSLIVYPESVTMDSYGFYFNRNKELYEYGLASNSTYPAIYNTFILYDMMRATQTYHLLGTPIIKENTNEDAYNNYEYYNGMEFIDYRGEVLDEYSKIKLVPGGEAYPFQDNEFLLNTFPFKNIINFMYQQFDKAGAAKWNRGKKITVFNHPRGYTFSGLICYESAFGDFVRQFAYNGAETLAVITEDAWSYSDESLLQHFYMSVFRAIENRRDLVHNGNSGVTGHISSSGKVISTIPFWQPDYMIANVALNDRITIYTRFGEWFVWLCFIAIIVLTFFSAKKDFIKFKKSSKEKISSIILKIKLNNRIKKKLKKIQKKNEIKNNQSPAEKIHSYINNDNVEELPSLDDIEDSIKSANTEKKKPYNIFDEQTTDMYSVLDDIMEENNEKKYRN